jgi:hypothetical protein
VHTGWATISADTEGEARLVVPPRMRHQARVVRVSRFDAATIAQVHEPALLSPAMLHMYGAFPASGSYSGQHFLSSGGAK